MARVLSLAGSRDQSMAHERIGWNPHLLLDLLPPALLLGLLRTWATELAPRQGHYFVAEALLIAYAYFAIARSTYVNAHGRDSTGRYDRALAQKAGRVFHRGLRPFMARGALIFMVLVTGAFALDALTAGSGIQYRPNVHLAVLFAGLMIWARYGGAVALAAARWIPGDTPRFAKARAEMATWRVASSFALTGLAFAAVAVTALIPFKAGLFVAPSRYDQLLWSTGLFTALAMAALWLHSRWAVRVATSLDAVAITPEPLKRAA